MAGAAAAAAAEVDEATGRTRQLRPRLEHGVDPLVQSVAAPARTVPPCQSGIRSEFAKAWHGR